MTDDTTKPAQFAAVNAPSELEDRFTWAEPAGIKVFDKLSKARAYQREQRRLTDALIYGEDTDAAAEQLG